MRPFLASTKMTSTTTLRRCITSAAIEVSPVMPIVIASPPPCPTPLLGPTTQERARYRGDLVDGHVHKGREPVDGSPVSAWGLWTPGGADLRRPGWAGCG